MSDPETVVDYWLNTVGPKGWYSGGADLDREVRERFGDLWQLARDGGLSSWLADARGALAYIILTDQFPRNMFREDARAFATDKRARRVAEQAIHRGWDKRIPEPERQFFYLPFMHSECVSDQDRCVRLMLTRMPETGQNNLLHARAHREVIRRFGRFPYRNAVLGREMTASEGEFLGDGGYGAIVRELEAA